MPLAGQPRQHPVRGDQPGAGRGRAGERGMARDSAADERAEDEAEQHVEWTEAADRAALAEADDGEDDEIDENAACHRLVELERLIGKIAAEDEIQGLADLVEVD